MNKTMLTQINQASARGQVRQAMKIQHDHCELCTLLAIYLADSATGQHLLAVLVAVIILLRYGH